MTGHTALVPGGGILSKPLATGAAGAPSADLSPLHPQAEASVVARPRKFPNRDALFPWISFERYRLSW
jgi:hypothetical protein